MGQIKNYLNRLIADTTGDLLEADAVEYAIYSGWLKLTMDYEADKAAVAAQLPTIKEKFRRIADENIQVNTPMLELIGQIADFK